MTETVREQIDRLTAEVATLREQLKPRPAFTEEQMDALRDWLAAALTVHTEDRSDRRGSLTKIEHFEEYNGERLFAGTDEVVDGTWAVLHPEVRALEEKFFNLMNGKGEEG